MQYETTTVSILPITSKKITGQTATLSADDTYFILTATDSPEAGRHLKREVRSLKLQFVSGKVKVTTASRAFYVCCSTTDSRLFTLVAFAGLLISMIVGYWTVGVWWLSIAFATLLAFKTAYMLQKRYLLLGLLKDSRK